MTTRYRGSQLRILRSCAFAYAKQYVDETEPLDSPDLARGRNVHAAIAQAAKDLVETGMLNVHDVAYRACRGGNLEYAQALELLIRFQEAVGTEFEIDADKVILIEETLEMPLQLPDGTVVIFFGTPDIAERLGKNTARIQDWKTHFKAETDEEFAADPQLDRYCLLTNYKYPALKEFEITKRFIRYANSYRTRYVTEEQLPIIKSQLITEIMIEREIRAAGVYEATPGDWCALCGYHSLCPRIRKYRELGMDDVTIEDDDRARELAGDAIALGAFSKRIEDRLKIYLGNDHKTGFVPLSGGTYGYAPVDERHVPAPKLIEVLERNSLKPDYGLFNTDSRAVDKLIKRSTDQVAKEIEGITLRSQSSRCQFRRGPHPTESAAPVPAAAEDALL